MRQVRRASGAALAAIIVAMVAPALGAADQTTYGSWSPAASMATARYGAVAATLSDGRVLVAGGMGETAALSSTEIYDPTTNTWSSGAPLPSPLWDGTAAPLPNDEVLVAGGSAAGSVGSGGFNAGTEIYDGATNTWRAGPSMPVALEQLAASPLGDGRVLVSGTSTEGATNELFDPATDSWTLTESNGGYGFDQPAAAPLGAGRTVLIGDGDDGDSMTTTEMYDASNDTWTFLPIMYGSRSSSPPDFDDGAAAALPGGAVLAVGSDYGTSAAIYDPAIHDWIPAAPISSTRSQPIAATLPDGDVLVAGGATADDGAPLASTMIFTPPASLAGVEAEVEESPQIDGAPYVGEKLTAFGVDGSSFSYQWERCQNESCSPIGPPSPSTSEESVYTLTSADIGYSIEAVATDTGLGDQLLGISQTSNLTGVVGVATMGFNEFPFARGAGVEMALSRDDTKSAASVHYEVTWPVIGREALVGPIAGTFTFLPGQWLAEVTIPTVSHGVSVLPREFVVTLSDPVGAALTGPAQLTVPICPSGAPCVEQARNPLDPLALPRDPGSDPLRGAELFIDHQSAASKAAAAVARTDPHESSLLDRIAKEPGTARYGAWNGAYPGQAVQSYLNRAAQQMPGSVPLLATYRIVDGQCHHGDDTDADAAIYHDWIVNFAEGIGDRPAVLFLEMDSLITTPCLSKAGLAIRLGELRDALAVLSNCPHLVVYLDAGAADALSARRAAQLLEQAGVADAQGFFLNSTHFDWTRKEIAYGEHISRLLHGKHFVINTAENGQGPLKPRHPARQGNEVLCNPPGRGLGPLPSTDPGHRHLDAFAWIANPGVSGGKCRHGAPKTGVFWPTMAVSLAQHADFTVR